MTNDTANKLVANDLLDGLIKHQRDLPLPSVINIVAEGQTEQLQLESCYRLLPGKRIVCKGRWQNVDVAVKLFVKREGASRHCKRETQAYAWLQSNKLPTAKLLTIFETACGRCQGLIYQWLDDTEEVASYWPALATKDKQILFVRLLELLRKLYDAGLVQEDIHFGNFLVDDCLLSVLDLGSIRRSDKGKPLSERQTINNLGQLLAQLEVAEQHCALQWLQNYASAHNWFVASNTKQLERSMQKAWLKRLHDYVDKSDRECRLSRYEQSFWHKQVCRRDQWSPELKAILESPDISLNNGERLKSGNTATIARINYGSQKIIIKRYNLKNWRHAFIRLWRKTRGEISWRNAHLLELAGIATAKPICLHEERWGWLRRRAWLICESIEGEHLLNIGQQRELDTDELHSLKELLVTLKTCRFSHGDMKASNLLLHQGQVQLIDLDGMRQHHNENCFRKHFTRDLERLKRNWSLQDPAYRQIDALVVELLAT